MIIGKTRTNQPVEGEEELKIFENIVDKDGHARFVEEDITIETITGITSPYAKWSLSGTHLLIVLCLNATNNSTLTSSTRLCDIKIPSWVYDKIAVVWGADSIIRQEAKFYADNWSNQTINVLLSKANNVLTIYSLSDITFTADRKVRIAFDLLVDNE